MENKAKIETHSDLTKKVQKNSFEDRAYGCIIGAFVGDSCGSFMEFYQDIPSEEEMDVCM